jgi:hypothetical protein
MDPALIDLIVSAELDLLDPSIRRDPAELEARLDPDFTEIGQSGTFWTREAVLADLMSSDQSRYVTAQLSEPRVLELAERCYLLTYVVQMDDRHSRRSSIWRMRDGRPRMVFNQGTPLTSQGVSE